MPAYYTSRRSGGFEIFGISIHIDRSWFIIVAFVTWTLARGYFPGSYPGLNQTAYWIMGASAALLLFVCVLLHELGHCLVAKAFGIPVARITLFIFGGVAQITHEARRPSVELLVALAGPAVSVAIAAWCFKSLPLLPDETPAQVIALAIVHYLAIINVVIVVFNLLPGFPLDGGRVLRALLWVTTGSFAKATRIASRVGSGLGMGLFGLGVWAMVQGVWFSGMWYILLGIFLMDAARASYRAMEGRT